MALTKTINFKLWLKRLLLSILAFFTIWLINLIWFKPFNIHHFYNREFVKLAISDPQMVTQLKLPILYNRTKDDLTDLSDQGQWKQFNIYKEALNTLDDYNFDRQSADNQLNTKIMRWYLKSQVDREPYFYNRYVVNHKTTFQLNLPVFMQDFHRLESKSDAEAYITRLSKFDDVFLQAMERLKIQEERGIIPPGFIIDNVLEGMNKFINEPVTSNILYSNFNHKVDSIKGISEEEKEGFLSRIENEINTSVFNAYNSYIDYFKDLKTQATSNAGAWKLPDGDDYYRYELRLHTSTDMSPEEIHQLGLREIERIQEEMWQSFEKLGVKDRSMSFDEAFRKATQESPGAYITTEDEESLQQKVLKVYAEIIDHFQENMGGAFDLLPKAGIEVKRVPEFAEGNMGTRYTPPSSFGESKGIFYVDMNGITDQDSFERYGMKTLAYHEAVPGHHFQSALQSEMKGVPFFRKVIPFSAYIEGWAFYTERLVWEMGFYEGDPLGNIGRLWGELLRAVRLVVDTGLHYKKWTRDQAIEYYAEHCGLNREDATIDIDRYIIMPGQACAYTIGMHKILELRERAKMELGDQFQLKEFHNVVIKNGAVPLAILEELVDEWIQDKIML